MADLVDQMKDKFKESKIYKMNPFKFFLAAGIEYDVEFILYETKNERTIPTDRSEVYHFKLDESSQDLLLMNNTGDKKYESIGKSNIRYEIPTICSYILEGKYAIISNPVLYYCVREGDHIFYCDKNFSGINTIKDNFYRATKNYYLSEEEVIEVLKKYNIE